MNSLEEEVNRKHVAILSNKVSNTDCCCLKANIALLEDGLQGTQHFSILETILGKLWKDSFLS